MKCPKCGYTSFDFLDNCKKCGVDLSAVRSMLGVIAISPDEMALATPKGPTLAEPEPLAATVDDYEVESHKIEQTSAILPDLDEGEDLFGNLVEPTSYSATTTTAKVEEKPGTAPKPTFETPSSAPPAGSAEQQQEEEFLDLDFGGIFEEEEKK